MQKSDDENDQNSDIVITNSNNSPRQNTGGMEVDVSSSKKGNCSLLHIF